MRKKTAHLQRIDEILARALKKRQVPFRADDRNLADVWEKAVGPQTAAQSRPVNLRKGILFVKVSSSVWMQQLHFLKEEIICKFNVLEKVSIKDIRFSIGQLPSPGKGEEHVPLPLSTNLLKERDKKMMEDCLASFFCPSLSEGSSKGA